MLLECQQYCGLVFDGTAEAEPRGQRDAARGLQWHVAEVESDQAEASAFEQQVGGAKKLLQRVLSLARSGLSEPESCLGRFLFDVWFLERILSATHPKQAIQFYSGGGDGAGIKGVAGIDDYAEFAAARGGGEGG